MRRAALGALLSHWRRRPGQLATLLIGLALATALWSAVQAINTEARASYAEAATIFGPAPLDRITDPSGSIEIETFAALRRAGWPVSPVLEGSLRLGEVRLRVIGVDPLTAPALPQALGQAAEGQPMELLTGRGLAVAAPETVAALEGIPDLPRLSANASVPPGQLITDIAVAARLLEAPAQISRLVLPEGAEGLRPLAEIAPGLTRSTPQPDGDIARLTDSFHLNLTAFGLLSFAVGLFIVHGAIGLAFEQRRPVFRTLRALGLPARDLLVLLGAELLILSLVAGAVGLAAGYLIAGALLPDVAATLRGLYGAEVAGGLEFRPAWALGGLLIAVGGTAIAAAQGLWRVAWMPLLASARPRAWARASDTALIRQALFGLGLLGMGALFAIFGSGLVAGFALLGGLLMGAALTLPLLLSAMLALGQRFARGALAQWVWADTRQQVPGLSLALMALLLALATNIGVGTMVASFRLTFTGWLDQRLAAELYVTAPDETTAARLRPWLEDRAEAVLPIWSVRSRINGRPAEVFGFIDHATYRENWPLLQSTASVWADVTAGEAALINEQLARRSGLGIGDTVTLAEGWEAVIAGVYSDYGNPAGQAMVGLDSLTARYPDVPRLRYGVRIAPDQAAALSEALISDFGLPEAAIVPQAAIKAFSVSVFERTFTVTGALNLLTLSVAGFAILTALLTLASMRLPQLAPVWAMGLTRRRLALLEVLRSMGLAALTCVAALPLGLGLAWVLLSVVNVEAFGWKLPMFIFPGQWLWVIGTALIAALLAALLPVRRLARTPPARFLQVFAHER